MSAEELPEAPRPQGQHSPRPRRSGTALTPVGVSRDGSRLLLVDDVGSEFTVAIDRRLRAALRGDSPDAAPLGQLEIKMDSSLRPRDIQQRIRSGASAEEVAAAAGTSVDKIMAFAGPVLAEREHVARTAQKSSVRRRTGEGAGAVRTLGAAVEAWLHARNSSPASVEWDAWRREDGRWSLVAAYVFPERQGRAEYTYDQRGSFVTADNDDARWLIGDLPERPAPRNDLAEARARRRTPDHDTDPLPFPEESALGDDAIELVTPTADADAPTAELGEVVPEVIAEAPVEAYLDSPDQPAEQPEQPDARDETAGDTGADVPSEEESGDEPPAKPARRPVRKNRGRASVPSWDEIMFGGPSSS